MLYVYSWMHTTLQHQQSDPGWAHLCCEAGSSRTGGFTCRYRVFKWHQRLLSWFNRRADLWSRDDLWAEAGRCASSSVSWSSLWFSNFYWSCLMKFNLTSTKIFTTGEPLIKAVLKTNSLLLQVHYRWGKTGHLEGNMECLGFCYELLDYLFWALSGSTASHLSLFRNTDTYGVTRQQGRHGGSTCSWRGVLTRKLYGTESGHADVLRVKEEQVLTNRTKIKIRT